MRIPFRRYAVWCFLQGSDEDQFKKHLDDLSLPVPWKEAIEEMRDEAARLPLPPPMRKRLAKRAPWDPMTAAFLTRLGYGEIYDYQAGRPDIDHHLKDRFERVWRLVGNPTGRVAIECAILAKIKHDELCGIASGTIGITLTSDMLELYERVFFDTSAITKGEWREYLKLVSEHSYVYVRYLTALTKSREEALYYVGLPTKTQLGTFLNQVLNTANFKFQRYSGQNDQEADKQARAWAKIGIEAGIRAEKFASSDVRDFADAVQAEFEYVDQPVENITPEMLAEIKPDAGKGTGENDAAPVPPPPVQVDPENY